MDNMKILFITKKRSGYGCYSYGASGLAISARFLVDMLNDSGIEAKLSEVIDNNDIDREVSRFLPDVVIIEAFWVVPEKFDILKELHPTVRWIVRGHSDFPFLATEGVAIEWIFGYLERGVQVSFNDPRTTASVREIAGDGVYYLPNYYPLCGSVQRREPDGFLNIGCFGAIRPLKNQLIQAVAAIRYANETDQNLRFYINSTRCEQGGETVLRNLRSLFGNTGYELVECRWRSHKHFLHLVRKMDVEMAVSFSETFCITAADAVVEGVPLICSSEVPWASDISVVPATNADAMVQKLDHLHPLLNHTLNHRNLRIYSKKSKKIWLDEFSE